MDYSPPGSPVHGILQARILEWVPMPSSRGSAQPRDWTCISCFAGRCFTTEPPGKPKGVTLLLGSTSRLPGSVEQIQLTKKAIMQRDADVIEQVSGAPALIPVYCCDFSIEVEGAPPFVHTVSWILCHRPRWPGLEEARMWKPGCPSEPHSSTLPMVQKPCMRRWGHHWTLASKKVIVSVMQTIFDPVDCSPQGSSVHGVFQARILEWVAISFSRLWMLAQWLTELIFCHSLCSFTFWRRGEGASIGFGGPKPKFQLLVCILAFFCFPFFQIVNLKNCNTLSHESRSFYREGQDCLPSFKFKFNSNFKKKKKSHQPLQAMSQDKQRLTLDFVQKSTLVYDSTMR